MKLPMRSAKNQILLPSSSQKYVRLLMIVVALIGIIPAFTQNAYILTIFSLIMIYGVLAMSLDVLTGYMGLSSLGHAGYFGVGAYTVAYLTTAHQVDSGLAILAAIGLSALVSMLFGLLTLKVWDVTFQMVNMALCMVIWGLAMKLTRITNGEVGITGVPRPTLFGFTFQSSVSYYYLLFAIFLLVVIGLYHVVNSFFGLTCLGIKQSPQRMKALGYNIYKHKYVMFVISGTIAGIAGIMLVMFNGVVSPTDANTTMSSKAFLMTLVGGTGTLVGPVFGASLIVLLENVISAITQRWTMILGAIYVFTVMFSPRGIMGIADKIRSFIRTKREERRTMTVEK